jgi:hypothetical protein
MDEGDARLLAGSASSHLLCEKWESMLPAAEPALSEIEGT